MRVIHTSSSPVMHLAPVVAAQIPAVRSTTFHLPGAASTVEINPSTVSMRCTPRAASS